jgi:hypothetical protein
MPQPEPLDPLPVTGGMFSPFAGSGSSDIPASCGPPYVSYPGPPAASPVVSAAPSYEPARKYQASDSLAAAVAQGGANQFRIFTSEEKRIDDWNYACILAAREWFYQHKTNDESYNKQLMTRIIRGDKQAGAQSAVVSYFIKNKEWSLVKKGVKWYDVHTDLQWIIYLDCYRASVTDPSNPNLPMLDRLMAAMCKIPDVGKEVEVLGTALEKGLLDLGWADYIPDPRHPGEVTENPRNLEVIKQFLNSMKAPDI